MEREPYFKVELDRWCFATETGEVIPTGEAALRSAFGQGRLGPDTLVWRSGWKHWMKAEHVRQFSKALGERAGAPQEPLIDLRQKQPPPLPEVEESLGPTSRFSTPIPPPHRPKPLMRRPPMPTIDEAGSPAIGGDTLRPPGAVPPPPRGTPKSLIGESTAWDVPTIEELDGPSHHPSTSAIRHSSGNAPSHTPSLPTSVGTAREDPNIDVPPEELSAPAQPEPGHPPISYDPDSLENRPSTPNLHVRVWSRMQLAPREKRIAIALVALAAVSLALGSWFTLRRPRATVRQAVRAEPTLATPRAAPPAACAIARTAQRISPSVLMSVTPIVADEMTAGRLVVGFADGPTSAAGITIDPLDLDVAFPFRETNESRVVSAAPLLRDGRPVFHVVRENQALKRARAVDASVDFLFGLSEAGFARQPLGGAIETVWAAEGKANVTDPRISSLSGLGHAVTFRQGGLGGSLHLGWLTEDGHAMAGPFQVKSPVGMLGTPSVASSHGRALVAYAGRNTDSEHWGIYVSLAEVGQPPHPAMALVQPAGGPGGDSIAPAVVAMPQRRWLLQWAEGPQGQRQVRIQSLDEHAQPDGVAHTVSPVGSNSGQGALWSSGQRAVSIFMVSAGRGAELWATPINCAE